MAKKSDTNTTNSPSDSNAPVLAKFQLSFEYNHTWSEAKQNMQHRPAKS